MDGAATQGCRRQGRGGTGLAILRCPHHERSRVHHPSTPRRSSRAPSPDCVSDTYVLWDAAYVLGSLSWSDRREYEAHLSGCPSCRESLTGLSAMPALLAQLTRDDVAAIDEDNSSAPPPLSPRSLTSLRTNVGRRRRRSRLAIWTVVVAAVLMIGVLVAVHSDPVVPIPAPPQAAASILTMTPGEPTPLNSTVTISRHDWGTHIEMKCTYRVWPQKSGHGDIEPGDKLAMVVVGRDGSHSQLATWAALTDVTATPGGSTSMRIDQIAAVQITSADRGDVLLQRRL
jgi:hypothetical protein